MCPECGKLSEKGKYCKACRPKKDLTGIIIAAHFDEGPLKELIHTYKYEGLKDLDVILSKFLTKSFRQYNLEKNFQVTYVPLHPSRQRWRGYNQSKLLAEKFAKKSGLKLLDSLLTKTKKTKTQIGLKRKERLKNQKDSFKINLKYKKSLKNKNIIIVDDVITTGATLNECAKELRKHGTKEIWGLVLGKH